MNNSTVSSRPTRIAVFEAIAAYDFNPDGTVTDEQREAAYEAMREFTGRVRKGDVDVWLDNMAKHTPFIDPVAISRAVNNLDLQVIENLSTDETLEFYDRLVAHPFPYGEDRFATATQPNGTGDTRDVFLSPRRQAWLALPESLRERIFRAVWRRTPAQQKVKAA